MSSPRLQSLLVGLVCSLLAAACLVALLPAIAVFLALQKLLMRALTGGALKG